MTPNTKFKLKLNPTKNYQGELSLAIMLLFSSFLVQAKIDYQEFLTAAFTSKPVENKMWLLAEKKQTVTGILNHPYKKLRVSYWTSSTDKNTSAWILQEIGKEKDIDVGIVIKDGAIQKLRILAFRESRGWEVKLPFFTKQFEQNKLTADNKLLNRVNNISGATLSWRAVTKLARVALYLDSKIE